MVKFELYEAKQKDWRTEYPIFKHNLMPNCFRIDSILKKVMTICMKNSNEVDIGKEELIWFDVMDTLFYLKNNELMQQKRFCREYFERRIGFFTKELVSHIPFKNFIEYCAKYRKEVTYNDL